MFFAGGAFATPDCLNGTSAVIDIYDSLTNTWQSSLPLSESRTALAAASLSGMLFFAGGVRTDGTFTNTVVCHSFPSFLVFLFCSLFIATAFLNSIFCLFFLFVFLLVCCFFFFLFFLFFFTWSVFIPIVVFFSSAF